MNDRVAMKGKSGLLPGAVHPATKVPPDADADISALEGA